MLNRLIFVVQIVWIGCITSKMCAQVDSANQMRIVHFGDGITSGEQDEMSVSQNYGNFVQLMLAKEGLLVDVINAGKPGDRTDIAISRMQQDVIIRRPDVVTLMFGTFDALVDPGEVKARVPLNVYRNQLSQMITYLKGINIVPVLMTTPPLGDVPSLDREPYTSAGINFLMEPYMDACRALAEKEKIPLIDHFSHWKEQQEAGKDINDWLIDGLLPNKEGQELMAELMLPTLLEVLSPTKVDVFVSGEGGYNTYRIPAVIRSPNGFLLAFCEGRSKRDDHAQNDIVLKRSYDQGNTWDSLQVVASEGNDALNNPLLVIEEEMGRIFLMYQHYPEGYGEKEVLPGIKGDKVCRTHIVYSDDDGKTWSEPEEITKEVKRPKEVTSIAGGPGVGIQLKKGKHAGRLVMPYNQGPWGDWKVYMVYSDNQGKSWKYGEVATGDAEGMANEVQVIEMSDGTLMLNARNMMGDKCRKTAYSQDGGETWSPLQNDSTLIEPQCQASILKFNPYYTLFSNPASQTDRENGTIRLSKDNGQTWPYARTLYEGSFAYSCLTRVNDLYAGVLYERDDYSKITFSRFPIKWILASPTQTNP